MLVMTRGYTCHMKHEEFDHQQWRRRNIKDVQQKHGHVVNKMQNYLIKFKHVTKNRYDTANWYKQQRGTVHKFMTNVKNHQPKKGAVLHVSKAKSSVQNYPSNINNPKQSLRTWNPPQLVLCWHRPQQHPALKQSDFEDTRTSLEIPQEKKHDKIARIQE